MDDISSLVEFTPLQQLIAIESNRESVSLVSNKHYSAGETIAHGLPFAQVILGIHKAKRCDYCLKTPKLGQERLRRCSKCKNFYYCDSKCQNLDWKAGHRYKECLLYQVDEKHVLEDNECSRMMARIYLRLLAQPKLKYKKYVIVDGMEENFSNLKAHYQDILADPDRIKDFSKFYLILHNLIDQSQMKPALELKLYLKQNVSSLKSLLHSLEAQDDIESDKHHCHWNQKLMFEYFCKICINAYSMSSQELKNLATAIYIHGAVIDHSCYPTATITFIDNRLVLKTACDILPSEKISVPYCDLKENAEFRNLLLQERYYFKCCCPRCTNYKKLEEKIDYSQLKYLDSQMDRNIRLKKYKEALNYGLKSLDVYCKIYRQSYHPDLTLQLLKVGKIRLNLGDTIKDSDYDGSCSLQFFKEKILTHMRVTHGLNSPLHKQYISDFATIQQDF